jgi:protein phosphatase 1 regulatory subunit 16A
LWEEFHCVYMSVAGFTDDVLEYIRVSVPKNMLADLKDSLKQGRSLNVQDKYGATALHVAAANGYTDVLNFILSQDNTNLDVQDTEGWTPFHAAVCWEQQEAMRLLAEKGASMDTKNLHGETPYAIADEPEIREYILQLKSEFGQAADRAMEEAEAEKSEELGPRTRRLSVRRMRQADKNNMMKDSIKEEVMLRRESMVRQDHDRDLMTRQGSSGDMVPMGDEDGPVELTSIRRLDTIVCAV